MEIIIDMRSGGVSIDGISRSVIFPIEYQSLGKITYDTETSIGLGQYVGNLAMGSILATALGLWHAAAPTADDMWVLIKDKRTQMNAGGVFVLGDWYHTDPETLSNYAIMYASISVNSLPSNYVFSSRWKTMDGDFRSMSVKLLKSIINRGMDVVATNFTTSENHKALLIASSIPSKYDYSTGWVKVHT